ncbi:hypothetical protein ACGC1H_003039 [Rhizoctonia solani]
MREQSEARTTEWVTKVHSSLLDKTKQTKSAWGTGLIHPSRPAIGVTSHQEFLLSATNDYIYKGMKKAILDNIPNRLACALDVMLFPSQISFWLKREVPLALQEGSRLGAQQFFDEAKARRNSQFPAPISSGTVNFDVLNSNTSSVMDIDCAYRSLKERAQRQAEKTLTKAYDEMVDTLAADLFIGSDVTSDLVYLVDHRSGCARTAQEYLTERMVDHFKQVEGYGFGKAERSIERVEESMAEIWVSVLGMMKDKSKLSFL